MQRQALPKTRGGFDATGNDSDEGATNPSEVPVNGSPKLTAVAVGEGGSNDGTPARAASEARCFSDARRILRASF